MLYSEVIQFIYRSQSAIKIQRWWRKRLKQKINYEYVVLR